MIRLDAGLSNCITKYFLLLTNLLLLVSMSVSFPLGRVLTNVEISYYDHPTTRYVRSKPENPGYDGHSLGLWTRCSDCELTILLP